MAFSLRKLRPRKVWNFILKQAGLRPKAGTKGLALHQGTSYGVDQLLFVSGFGAFASGWLLTPRRHVRNVSLLVGGQTLEGDRRSLLAKPRPDLATAFAEHADAVSTAGFQAVFRGHAPERGMAMPLLRVHLDDGTAPVMSVSERVVRLCDGSEALATVARYFPSLAHESFLEDFVEAFAARVRRRAAEIVPIVTAKAAQAAILVLPRQSDDLLLALADIRRSAVGLPPDVGLVLVTNPRHPRARILDRFDDLRLTSGRPMSLFEVSDPTYALWSIAPILAALGASRFWFCGSDVMATQAGWRAAASYFADDRSSLELFLRPETSGGLEPESLSFAWSANAFGAWADSAPFFLGGFHRDNHLPAEPAPVRIPGAIGLLRTMVEHEPIRRADERLYRTALEHRPEKWTPVFGKADATQEPRASSWI